MNQITWPTSSSPVRTEQEVFQCSFPSEAFYRQCLQQNPQLPDPKKKTERNKQDVAAEEDET